MTKLMTMSDLEERIKVLEDKVQTLEKKESSSNYENYNVLSESEFLTEYEQFLMELPDYKK